jgi:hypothetical protein
VRDDNLGRVKDHRHAGYLCGLLQGASPDVCGVMGSAASVAGGGAESTRSLSRDKLLRLLRDVAPRVRGKRQAEAVREAIVLLSPRGSNTKRRRTRRNMNRG